MDDWTEEDQSAEEPASFEFTAFYATPEFELMGTLHRPRFQTAALAATTTQSLDLTARRPQVTALRAAQWTLVRARADQQGFKLSGARQGNKLRSAVQTLDLHAEDWRAIGVLRRVLRHMRRQGSFTAVTLQQWKDRWQWPTSIRVLDDLRSNPHYFVESAPGEWRLTPWERLDVPFETKFPPHAAGFYEWEAVRFWLTHQHVPTPAEEWSANVRAKVQHEISLGTVPPYLKEVRSGPFVQQTALGQRAFKFDIDQMPEGPYFTLRSPRGNRTYSVNGRAFMQDDANGTSLMTAFLNLRLREALLRLEGDPGIEWHAVGLIRTPVK